MSSRTFGFTVLLLMALATAGPPASAQTAAAPRDWLAAVEPNAPALGAPIGKAEPPCPPGEWTKPLPVSVGVEYALVSDYVFRGINYSEYPGEGREKLNHQLMPWIEIDTGPFGVFGACLWFEWYAATSEITTSTSSSLYEVDYTGYWRYEVAPAATTVELGWSAYTYPQSSGDAYKTYELYAKLTFDDSKLFGTKDPVLNPSIGYWHDIDLVQAGWLEVAVEHPFALGDFEALKKTPFLKDLTITPSLALGVDHRYLPKALGTGQVATRLGNITYGLDVCYDLSSALGLPPQAGSLKVGGFLNFSQALRDELIDDELWGGMKVSYSW
jgi:hypothetical protein